MGATALSQRDNWQQGARLTGDAAKNKFAALLAAELLEYYEVTIEPPKLEIYSDGKGIVLDVRIRNMLTDTSLYAEVKGGDQGGNATEERAAKFLSEGIKRRVRSKYRVPHEPFFTVFTGDIFNGRDGNRGAYIIERTSKKTGKITKTKVHPVRYREKVDVMFEGQNYAIMDADYSNIDSVTAQIREIV
jgi:hypothetical protein